MERFLKWGGDHVLFWIATVSFHLYTRLDLIERVGFGQFAGEVVIRNALLAVIIYVNLLLLIPRFARRKKWGAYTFLLVLSFLFYVLAKNAHDVYLYRHIMGDLNFGFYQNTFYNFSIAFFYMTFGVALHLSREWFVQQQLLRKIKLEKLNAELEYLKAQINPHFLFNSINTIFFQIDRQNSIARDALSSFSDMLRYQLYECNGHEIPVEKEIAYLKNYVNLQRHRWDDNYQISFSEDNISDFSIAPLLLIPFVENAFKHVSHFPQGNEIRIDLCRSGNAFRMSVFNTCQADYVTKTNGGGIGLKNVQRRLELLYPGKHNLEFLSAPGSFQVNLEITIPNA
jgi:LytS/YehU family sensor histidine kinase